MKNLTLQQLLKSLPDDADISIRLGFSNNKAVFSTGIKNVYAESLLGKVQDDFMHERTIVIIDVDF